MSRPCFVGRLEDDGITLLTERTSDGERAVLVFDDPRDAEVFRVAEGLGDEWEVMRDPPHGTAGLVERCLEGGVRYAALNPPTRLTRDTSPDPALVSVRTLAEDLSSRPRARDGSRDRAGCRARRRAGEERRATRGKVRTERRLRVLFGRLLSATAMMLALTGFLTPGGLGPAGPVGLAMGATGYALGARVLGTAAVAVSAARILLGLAVG